MPNPTTDRGLLRRARRRLDEWLYEARSRAFEALFEGDDARLSEEELGLLDRIDAEMNSQERDGVWGTDQYGIVASGATGDEGGPRVVCVYHPEIPEDFVYPGDLDVGELDDATEEKLNDALWDYAELVAGYAQVELETFVEREGVS